MDILQTRQGDTVYSEPILQESLSACHADPRGPPVTKILNGKSGETIKLPRASVNVLRGRVSGFPVHNSGGAPAAYAIAHAPRCSTHCAAPRTANVAD